MAASTLTQIGGWSAYASGGFTLLGLVFIGIFFRSMRRLFGSLNDICIVLQVILLFPTALALQQIDPGNSEIQTVTLLLLVVGIVLMTVSNLLLVMGRIEYQKSLLPAMTSFALIGVWLLAANISRLNSDLPSVLGWLGIGAGIGMGMMALGYLFSGYQDPQKSIVGLIGGVGGFLLYPVWAIWLGRILLTITR